MTFDEEITEFVLESLFEHREADVIASGMSKGMEFDQYWYAPVKGGGEGWIVIWGDGSHHHTYLDPSEWYR